MNTSLDISMNTKAMSVLSDMRPYEDDTNTARLQTAAISRAIDALYMQNKLLKSIESLKKHPCFVTDCNGATQLLESFVVGSETELGQ